MGTPSTPPLTRFARSINITTSTKKKKKKKKSKNSKSINNDDNPEKITTTATFEDLEEAFDGGGLTSESTHLLSPVSAPNLVVGSRDDGRTVALICTLLLGAANVTPWLAFISTTTFFSQLFPEAQTSFVFPVLNMSLLVFGTVITALYGRSLSLRTRLLYTNCVTLIFLPVTPFIVAPLMARGYIHPSIAICITYFSLSICSLCTSVNQATGYGFASLLPSGFMVALESGKGYSGLLIILLRVMLKAIYRGHQSETLDTQVFFLVSTLVVLAACVAFTVLEKLPFANEAFEGYDSTPKATDVTPMNSPNPLNSRGNGAGKTRRHRQSFPAKVKDRVIRKILPAAIGVFLSFTTCISLFPGLTTSLPSRTMHLGDWFPILLVLTYNFSDLVGKSLPNYWMPATRGNIWLFVFAQACVLPLMVIINIYDDDDDDKKSAHYKFIHYDSLKFISVGYLGVMTGFSATCCLTLAPTLVKAKFKELAAQLMSIFLIMGLFAGSVLGLFIAKWTGNGTEAGGENEPAYPIIHMDVHQP